MYLNLVYLLAPILGLPYTCFVVQFCHFDFQHKLILSPLVQLYREG
jgi:hypothetical protein